MTERRSDEETGRIAPDVVVINPGAVHGASDLSFA
jgi:hypothetical protein